MKKSLVSFQPPMVLPLWKTLVGPRKLLGLARPMVARGRRRKRHRGRGLVQRGYGRRRRRRVRRRR